MHVRSTAARITVGTPRIRGRKQAFYRCRVLHRSEGMATVSRGVIQGPYRPARDSDCGRRLGGFANSTNTIETTEAPENPKKAMA